MVNSIEQHRYVKLIRKSAAALEPLPADLPPEWQALLADSCSPFRFTIKAVLFDVYGTLFISAAGDVAASADMLNSTQTANQTGHTKQLDTQAMRTFFLDKVKQYHEQSRAAGTMFPEVASDEIWAQYKGCLTKDHPLFEYSAREIALRYELAVNPVYPMPNAQKTITGLYASGITLGIISNAQFYTPLLFNAFFNASPQKLGFDPDLLIYSYLEKQAKPEPALFIKARDILASKGIKPEQTLYIGNDMRNDISPAAAVGFRTALFAGDHRSLRLRESDTIGVKPDIVVKDLQIITDLVT